MPIIPNADSNRSLRNITCFLLDMDGTFYLSESLIPGALGFLRALRERNISYLFLTNNSSKSGAHYREKLLRLGLSPEQICVYTSGQATCAYLNTAFPGKRVYLMGNASLKAEFEAHGIDLCDFGPDVVVAGYDTELTYAKLCDTCLFLRKGLPFIATHPDFNCPDARGPLPDLGAMLKLIEASTGRTPDKIIGKPYGGIIEGALKQTGSSTEHTAIVGDRLYTDIEAGRQNGLLSVLVMTGETTPDMLAESDIQPDLVFDSLKSMMPFLP